MPRHSIMFSSLFDFDAVSKPATCCAPDNKKKVTSPFRLPIQYVEQRAVPDAVLQDLELTQSTSGNSDPISHHIYDPQTPFATKMAASMTQFYTTDKAFLKDTQHVVQHLAKTPGTPSEYHEDVLLRLVDDLTDDENFMDKYYYLEWESLQSFNRSSTFLQGISMLNGVVPIANIFMTVFILFLPLLVMTLQGESWTVANYLSGLRTYGRDNIFTHIFSIFDPATELNFQTGFMLLSGVMLYAYQLYYNIHYTVRFYTHLQDVVSNLHHTRAFLQQTERKMAVFLDGCAGRDSYRPFVVEAQRRLLTVRALLQKLASVKPVGWNTDTLTHMGYHFECYYLLYAEDDYLQTLLYCMDFDGFVDNLSCVGRRLATGIFHVASFDKPIRDKVDVKEEDKDGDKDGDKEDKDGDNVNVEVKKEEPGIAIQFTRMYYPPFVKKLQEAVRNDVDFTESNGIVTGPNASGKTTFLKTAAINIVVTQQLGCGFYESACMEELYTHLHSYINIPDTSERDSLFEAETRRCKEILTVIETHGDKERHFCLFDELFSGTNPEEATQSALSYLRYLAKQRHVHFLLTTHYVDVCRRIEGEPHVANYRMRVQGEDKLVMEYRVEPGISDVKGAFFILETMGFPQQMMDDIRNGLEPIPEEDVEPILEEDTILNAEPTLEEDVEPIPEEVVEPIPEVEHL